MNEDLSQKLDEIEAELKRIHYWAADTSAVEARIANGEIKSYFDMPTFELWLQCVFLPNARKAVAENDLPSSSSVGLMAMRQYNYMSEVYEAHPLMNLLSAFDALIIARAKPDPSDPMPPPPPAA
jgi:uncharacterized protein YqcC (DUF446 family)